MECVRTLSGLKGPQVVRKVSLHVCSHWQSRLLPALVDTEVLNIFLDGSHMSPAATLTDNAGSVIITALI